MRRARFLCAAAAAAGVVAMRARAGATGGLDDFTPAPPGGPALRVLLGRGMAQPIDATSFAFGTRVFRGTFTTTPDGQIVNTVPLEQYLYGVVPMESPPSWPQEALRAQAIVARTFALSRSNPNRAYDVVASERDQAYGGLHAEYPQSTQAVDATAGAVLRYNGAIATVSYMSCCGGHTEDPADAWQGGRSLPYLRGVACSYCSASPDWNWQRSVPLQNLSNAFAAELAAAGSLQAVSVGATDASGRAKTVRFTGDRGTAEVTGADFRSKLGAAVVRSLLIRAIRLDSGDAQAAATITIEGSGRGHGVGLCQWGARGLAAQGRQARDILNFYFPGIEL